MQTKLQDDKVAHDHPRPPATHLNPQPWLQKSTKIYLVIGALIQALALTATALWWNGRLTIQLTQKNRYEYSGSTESSYSLLHPPVCYPPLPAGATLPQPDFTSAAFSAASARLDRYLRSVMRREDLDSLVVGVISSFEGLIFNKGYGVLRANETRGIHRVPNTDSIYRIASVSKMFAVLELLILKERGRLDWDDPVDLFLPEFTYDGDNWKDNMHVKDRASNQVQQLPAITLRRLATHMSGIGRDFPPEVLDPWPGLMQAQDTRMFQGPSREEVLESIATIPLVVPQYTYPVYSNTGFNVLGWTLTAAANATATYADLIARDVFGPLNLSGSSFNVTPENAHRIAVPSTDPDFADLDATDVANASGGQYSSLRDLAKVMQTFLVPSREDSLLSPTSIKEWLRPLHALPDDISEVGAPWEIRKVYDTYKKTRRWYGKAGNYLVYQTKFYFSPDAGFGVVVLLTGRYRDAESITFKAIDIYQKAFDQHIASVTKDLYGGRWISDDKKSEVVTTVHEGSIWAVKLFLDGVDMFKLMEGPYPVSKRYGLWSTGRDDEFRIAFGRGQASGLCFQFWASFDPSYAQGFPIDLLLFEGVGAERKMKVPSVGATLKRVRR